MNSNMHDNQTTWERLMSDLKSKHNLICDLIGLDTMKVAFIDIPAYFNVGDMLIYKGTECFISENRINVVYKSTALNVCFKSLSACDVILLQGGGNFGDLYKVHQDLREKIVLNFPDKRIIQLPQSIHYESKSELDRAVKLFSEHSDFHLLVRDEESFKIAQKLTNNAALCPDMAYSMHPLVEKIETGKAILPGSRLLNMVRKDKESLSGSKLKKIEFDWQDIITKQDRIALVLYLNMIKLPFKSNKIEKFWLDILDDIVFRSISYFSQYDLISTDRLHGLILSTLLGKNVIANDNSYGKNSRYIKKWLEEYPYFHRG